MVHRPADAGRRAGATGRVRSATDLARLSPVKALTTPIPLFGCSIWLDLNLPVLTYTTVLSGAGQATLAIPIPQNPIYIGARIAVQAGVGAALDISNAIDLTVN
jgi:hypothetical protein